MPKGKSRRVHTGIVLRAPRIRKCKRSIVVVSVSKYHSSASFGTLHDNLLLIMKGTKPQGYWHVNCLVRCAYGQWSKTKKAREAILPLQGKL